MSDLLHAVSVVSDHVDAYELAENYYDGSVDELFASSAVKRALRHTSQGYSINLARRPVDAVLDRIKIASVLVPGDEQATEVLVDNIWEANRLGRTARTVHRSALVHGDAYLMVWGGAEDGSVEVHYNSPKTMRLFYDDENPHVKSYAAKVWTIGATREARQTRVNLIYPDRIERYISRPGTSGKLDSDFLPFVDETSDERGVQENPYGVIPVFHFRTDEPYGRPEHADAYNPQNAITKLCAEMMAASEYMGLPQRFILRDPAQAMANNSGYPDDDDDDDDEGLNNSPGGVWDLQSAKSVGQFDAASPNGYIAELNFWARAMSAATGTPLRFLEPSGNVPSGESLRADEAPLATRIYDRITWLADTWRDAMTFAMTVAGVPVQTVQVSFFPVQVVSDEAGWRTVKAKIDAGVPQRVALLEAGYRTEQVDNWTEDSEATNLATRLEYLDTLSTAAERLQPLVASGLLPEAEAQRIMASLVADLLPANTGDDS